MNPNIGALASEGGRAKAAAQREVLAALGRDLPPLDSVEHAKARLEAIQDMVFAGAMPGSQANSAVRAVEVWLKAEAHALDVHRIKALEQQIATLEGELKQARSHALRVG